MVILATNSYSVKENFVGLAIDSKLYRFFVFVFVFALVLTHIGK